jgi:hypothetical protein
VCTGIEIAAIAGTALATRESIRAPNRGKTGQPKPPPPIEEERAAAKKRGSRARSRAQGGFGTQATFGQPGGNPQSKTVLGG